MERFFTSDHHHFHRNIIKYSGRPWTFEEQTEELIRRWNRTVNSGDHVYHLGDFAFGGPKRQARVEDIIRQLNGHIHFIRGNHCHKRMWRMIEQNQLDNVVWVKDYAEIRVGEQNIVLCHYALRHWNKMHYGSWNLHGHSHGSLPPIGKQLDVGIDNHPDFQLFSYDEVKEHMETQETVNVDHHANL